MISLTMAIKGIINKMIKKLVDLPFKIRLNHSANITAEQSAAMRSNALKIRSDIERRYTGQDRRQIDMPYSGQDRRQYQGKDRRQINPYSKWQDRRLNV
jgi:hypothetical protein